MLAYLRGEKEKSFLSPLTWLSLLPWQSSVKEHTFVNAKEKASSETMKNVYAKLQCRFFSHMMFYVLAGKEYEASVATVYFTPCTLMVTRNKTVAVHSNII